MRNKKAMQRSYTIQSYGDSMRIEETPERDAVVVSIYNADNHKTTIATIRLDKEQWDALTALQYSDIEVHYAEEVEQSASAKKEE